MTTTAPHATDTAVARRDRRAFQAETTERLTWLLDTMTRDLRTERHARRKATLTRQTTIIREVLAERAGIVEAAEVAVIVERAAALDALPTDDEPAGEPVDTAGVTTRTVGRDLYEVVVDGTAAGRVMMGAASWHGYDLAGTRITDLGVATLAEAVAAVVALGATPDAPHGTPRTIAAEPARAAVTARVTTVDEAREALAAAVAAEAALPEGTAERKLAGRARRRAGRRLTKLVEAQG